MALREVIEEILQEMEQDLDDLQCGVLNESSMKDRLLQGYIKQIKRALKASDQEVEMPLMPSLVKDPREVAAKLALKKQILDAEESTEKHVLLVGGPEDGDIIVIDGSVKVGDCISRPGNLMYELQQDGKLHLKIKIIQA